MRYAIPLVNDRVAPRCTFADSILMITVKRGRILEQSVVPMDGTTWADLAHVLSDKRVNKMICGGISRTTRESIQTRGMEVIENVAGPSKEVVDALVSGKLQTGYGFSPHDDQSESIIRMGGQNHQSHETRLETTKPPQFERPDRIINCLTCEDRICLHGECCSSLDSFSSRKLSVADDEILSSASDVSLEEERTLCRLAELVYFCLGMNYKRIGIAFCIDLLEPTKILSAVLQRFFDVFPVCCKVGGIPLEEHDGQQFAACNPIGQAEILNSLSTDLNVLVGLCVGVDCVFTSESHANVTTLFVKDKSLANNPIGAVYSHYHLNDI